MQFATFRNGTEREDDKSDRGESVDSVAKAFTGFRFTGLEGSM